MKNKVLPWALLECPPLRLTLCVAQTGQEHGQQEQAAAEEEEKPVTKRAKRKALERERLQEQKKAEEQQQAAAAAAAKPSPEFLKHPMVVSVTEGDLFSNASFESLGLSASLVEHLTGIS